MVNPWVEIFPNMKAMLPPRKRVGIKEFWFTTHTSSMRVAQYRENSNASVYFYDKRFFRGVITSTLSQKILMYKERR